MPTDQDIQAYIDRLPANESIRVLFRRYGIQYRWHAVATMGLANVATLSSGTMINVAIPEIIANLQISQGIAQRLSSAFLASSTIAMLLGAWCIQRAGMRLTVLLALLLFIVASALGSLSDTTELLVLARILQGACSGIITPLSMSLVFQLFPVGRQGLAMGLTTACMVVAPAIGPTIGGVIIDYFSWHYVFLLGVPAAILAIPLAISLLPTKEHVIKAAPFDWGGLVLLSLAVPLLLSGVDAITSYGWRNPALIAALPICIAWVLWERRSRSPLLKIEVFAVPQFCILALVSFMFGAGLYGSTYLLPLFFQLSLELSATQSGMLLLPAGLIMGACFPFSGRLADHFPVRYLISAGFITFAGSIYLFTFAGQGTSLATLGSWMIIGRIGIGVLGPALIIASFYSLPAQYVHHSAGAMNFVRQLGSAFGVSLISICLDVRTAHHRTALCKAVADCSQSQLKTALNLGFSDSFAFIALAFVVLLIPAWLLRPGRE